MPLATIPGIFSSGQPVASGTMTASKSSAFMTTQDVSKYISNSSTANPTNTSTFENKKEITDSGRDQKLKKLIDIASKEVGIVEDKGTDNRGQGIEKYWSATNSLGSASGYAAGWHWCAAFVSWCIKESGIFNEDIRPKEIAAFAFADLPATVGKGGKISKGNWFEHRGGKNYAICIKKPKEEDLQPGDIIVFSNSHVGLVASAWKDNSFTTIEGNTSPDDPKAKREIVDRNGIGVFKKERKKISNIQSIIRLYPDGIPNSSSDKTILASR